MNTKRSTIKFDDLPDYITYREYADWVGIGVNKAREKFKSKGFPLLKGAGKKLIANKNAVLEYDNFISWGGKING